MGPVPGGGIYLENDHFNWEGKKTNMVQAFQIAIKRDRGVNFQLDETSKEVLEYIAIYPKL